jgi:hypothetical protein
LLFSSGEVIASRARNICSRVLADAVRIDIPTERFIEVEFVTLAVRKHGSKNPVRSKNTISKIPPPPCVWKKTTMDHTLAARSADEGHPLAARSSTKGAQELKSVMFEEFIKESAGGSVETVRAYFEAETVDSLELLNYFSWQDARDGGDSKEPQQHYYELQNCLMAAVVSENIEVVKYLLARKGINLSACNFGGLNVLHFGAHFFRESTEIMELLLSSTSYEGEA